jgi:hypothetical protein
VRVERFMNTKALLGPCWSTASFGDDTDTSPLELDALGQHMQACNGSKGRLFGLHSAAHTAHGFMASRFVTTLALVAMLVAVGSLAF